VLQQRASCSPGDPHVLIVSGLQLLRWHADRQRGDHAVLAFVDAHRYARLPDDNFTVLHGEIAPLDAGDLRPKLVSVPDSTGCESGQAVPLDAFLHLRPGQLGHEKLPERRSVTRVVHNCLLAGACPTCGRYQRQQQVYRHVPAPALCACGESLATVQPVNLPADHAITCAQRQMFDVINNGATSFGVFEFFAPSPAARTPAK
jgi:hypothetical protein